MTADANELLAAARASVSMKLGPIEQEVIEALIDAKLAAANVLRFDPDAPQDDCYTPGGDDGSAPDKDAVPSPRSEASGSPLPLGTSTEAVLSDWKTWPSEPPSKDGQYFMVDCDYPITQVVWVLHNYASGRRGYILGGNHVMDCDSKRQRFWPVMLDPTALSAMLDRVARLAQESMYQRMLRHDYGDVKPLPWSEIEREAR